MSANKSVPQPPPSDLIQQAVEAARRLVLSGASLEDRLADLSERIRRADVWLAWVVIGLAAVAVLWALELLTRTIR